MTGTGDPAQGPTGRGGDELPPCAEADCGRDASFWRYDRDDDRWHPVCAHHAEHLHPSLEVHAWLVSGYMRPIERGRPEGPPPEPAVERGRAFREEVDALMGWSA